MAEITGSNGNHGVVALTVKDANHSSKSDEQDSGCFLTLPFMQKVIRDFLIHLFLFFFLISRVRMNSRFSRRLILYFRTEITVSHGLELIAELLGTYFLIFAGDAAVTVNLAKDKVVTLPGIAIVWGLAVMVMVYSVGHISGAHFNPAVTIAFATCKRFPWKEVPAYISAQVLGSTLASGTLRLIFNGQQDHFPGTLPSGTDLQSLVLEFVITFYLMFVISGVATDNRAIGELAGLAVGATVLLNVIIAGPISGASMNPARSLGPAFVASRYTGIWIYILAPISGAIAGAWVYNIIRFTNKPLREITKSASFLRNSGRNGST